VTKGRRSDVKELGRGGVQEYLRQQITAYGGMSEHFKSPGKTGVEDLIVTWPCAGWARIHFVETKTIGGELSTRQKIVQAERRAMGAFTKNIWSKDQADAYCEQYGRRPE
jgi:hypothetical protein